MAQSKLDRRLCRIRIFMPGKVITGKGALQDAENEFQTAGKKALIVSGKVMERVGNVKVSS